MAQERELDGLYVRTKSVDNTLKPLIRHVNLLVSHSAKHRNAGHSKSSSQLLSDVEEAANRFVSVGKSIADEYDDVRDDMLKACDDVESSGGVLLRTSRSYLDDPGSNDKRDVMTEVAKELLTAVTRLLVIADIVDVNNVRRAAKRVESRLRDIKQSTSQADVITTYRSLMDDITNLSVLTANRQQDVKDQRQAEKLAAARAQLKNYSRMVLTSSRAYIRYPEVASAKANRDFVVAQLCEALSTISSTVAEENASRPHPRERPGGLASSIEQFKNIVTGVKETSKAMAVKGGKLEQTVIVKQTMSLLNEKMDRITREATMLASSDSTRSFRRGKIQDGCMAVKEELQQLSDVLLSQNTSLSPSDHAKRISSLVDDVVQMMNSLYIQLRRATVDHVSDVLYDISTPLSLMTDAAKAANRRKMEACAKAFRGYCSRVEQVSSMVCNVSSNPEHVKMVKLSSNELRVLHPEVLNAAQTVMLQSTSKVVRDNLEAYEERWLDQVKLVKYAVDNIVDIDDFLAVSDIHVLEDLRKCMVAIHDADVNSLEQALSSVQGRIARICEVVVAEMQLYTDPKYSQYTSNVQQAISDLQESDVPPFASFIDSVLDQLNENSAALVSEQEFFEVASAVGNGVRRVKDIVQSVRGDAVANDPDADIAAENIEPDFPPPPPHMLDDTREAEVELKTERGDAVTVRKPTKAGRSLFRRQSRAFVREAERELNQGELTHLPLEQRQEIQALKEEKQQLETEVEKWNDNTNELIVLAKDMGMMLVEMSDFTRGAGPLKSTMELIATAKEIADTASACDSLVSSIADQCPDMQSKNELLASLERINFYSHQINITSKVKEDIATLTGDSSQASENAITLITTAKNLMNAVVATVKSAYVAWAKISKSAGSGQSTSTQWRLQAPSKVPLVRLESHPPHYNSQSSYGTLAPVRALDDFRGKSPPVMEGDEELL
ncbi:catenin alpha-like [Corticium candelabrum]|uniref:catenin alpha-like n=1 Tax=Corticium candelabrum TaxID=121492 RepID=UPI002E254DC2|nr:catenin alpha-like [Corticium candelabrum]